MDFGFLTDPDTTRYCYLRLRRLKQAIKDPKILDGLIQELEVPGQDLSNLSARKKMAAIELQIAALRGDKTSIWYGVSPPEVLAAAIFGARKLSGGAADTLFNDVTREGDLAAPIISWLTVSGFAEYKEIPPDMTRVDLVAYQAGRFLTKTRIIGVELHNDSSQLDGALERMTACAEFTNALYLACTPAMAADFVSTHASSPNVSRWDPAVLQSKLSALGFGLLLVEGDAVSESLAPKDRKPADFRSLKSALLRPR